ncbi:MAG TPA: bifunctional oligoribonuclease/PAP phosphatase NrnA, partial [Thermoanaerobaculia bacterium]|nr:bifunctional oligoribonuclease/PAP phosphatase NrnA [Thermoanaerobaculia bacterium]
MITDATRECFQKLSELIRRDSRGGRWLVLTHDNPDPDALASAMILSNVLRSAFKQRVTIAYGGIVGRAENRAFVRVLKLPIVPISRVVFDEHDLIC